MVQMRLAPILAVTLSGDAETSEDDEEIVENKKRYKSVMFYNAFSVSLQSFWVCELISNVDSFMCCYVIARLVASKVFCNSKTSVFDDLLVACVVLCYSKLPMFKFVV